MMARYPKIDQGATMKAIVALTTAAVLGFATPAFAKEMVKATGQDWTGKAGAVITSAGTVWIGKDGTIMIQAKDGKTTLMLEGAGDAMLFAPDGQLVDVDHGKASIFGKGKANDEVKELNEKLESLKTGATAP
jgi:hypothetical protein